MKKPDFIKRKKFKRRKGKGAEWGRDAKNRKKLGVKIEAHLVETLLKHTLSALLDSLTDTQPFLIDNICMKGRRSKPNLLLRH